MIKRILLLVYCIKILDRLILLELKSSKSFKRIPHYQRKLFSNQLNPIVMKKLCTIILALFISNNISYAQPVLNSSDFSPSTAYDLDVYSVEDVSGLSPGANGANVTWNFSGLKAPAAGKLSVLPVASTPYAASYPTANFCFKSIYGGDGVDYDYFRVTSTAIETVGDVGNGVPYSDIDHSTWFVFPYSYGTNFNDTYQSQSDLVIYSFSATFDAYGTLTTPYGTYNNVMRQKKVEVDGADTYTDYLWFTANPFKIVMTMSFDGSNDNSNATTFYVPSALNLKEYNKENLVLAYPNPATSKLNLELPNDKTIDKVVVTDVTGKIVIQETENTAQINIEKFALGLYIIELYSGKEKFTSKFIKK
jgi:hypothetical protein